MKRALLLESGRFRCYVNDGKAQIDPPFSEITDAADATAIAELTAAIKAEIDKSSGCSSLNDAALQAMLRQQAMAGQGWIKQMTGGLFGPSLSNINPFLPR